MKTFPLKHRVAMTRNSLRQPIQQLSALTGAALLTAGFLLAPMAMAQDPSKNTVDINLVGADIESAIKAIGHYTGVTFIIDPRVKGQINLVSETPLTKDQAFKLLTSTLRLQGFSVVTADGYSKVVPESDAKLQPGPTQNAGSARSESAKGDQVITQIYKLNYESSANIVTILRPLISPNNTINGNPGNNTVVITDYADNIKRLNKIIAALDVPATTDMDVILVKHAIASDITAMVSKVIDAGASGADPTKPVLLADPRSNAILVRASSVAKANQIKSLIAKLDQPTSQPGNVHVVYLKNAEAEKLAQTLRSIVTGDTSSSRGSSSNISNAGSAANGTNSPVAANTSGGTQSSMPSFSNSSTGNSSGGGGAAGYIQSDAATNTLIITASEPVYRNLRAVIEQLDARRAQVYVEALIVEMSADKSNELGVQWMGLSGDSTSNYRIGGGTSFSTKGNNLLNLAAGNAATAGSVLPGAGLSLGIFKQINGQLGLGALARVLQTDGNANVLSIPNIVTLDNEEANIIVGKNVPLITGQFTTGSGGSAGVNPFQTIERKQVGLKLKIKPQISEGGTVKLAIYQEVSSVDDTTNVAGIITKERSITTNVLVDDGQIIALGGLIEDSTTDGGEKVTGLGDLPIIGNLFKYQTSKRSKTNLMVFLRPTVIRNAEQSNNISVDRYDYMRTQIVPSKDGATDNLLPYSEKGRLLTTPLVISPEKAATSGKEGK
ncbi:type II secretion system secretin GspD [Undibacterium sp.]|uniref:type II secretion system secretin GspD n=1 Tax=Undibacterium sp. TaxID=1914977 RepID=UPI0027315448|nr:type II secretion system secretin GspD [Undibacterium sp.]MDP1979325.1 type II secretion system secretin GspD [Undibacterium sp.]